MKSIRKMIAVILASVVLLTACGAQMSNDAVASVNGVEISKEYYDKTVAKVAKDTGFVAAYGPQVWDMEIEPGVTFKQDFTQKMLDMIIKHEIVMQKLADDEEGNKIIATDDAINDEYTAYMEIVNKDTEYAQYLKDYNIDEAFIKDHLKKTLSYRNFESSVVENTDMTDEDVKAYYDEHIADYTHNEVRASHILISILDENDEPLSDEKKVQKLELAQEVILKAENGEDFAQLAKEYSDDTVSAAQGGDLDFFEQGVMVSEFNDKVFSMEVGEISDIVETQFGYHIIYLTDKNNEVEKLEDVSYMIKEQLKNDVFEKQIEEMLSKAKTNVNQELTDIDL